LEAAVDLRTLLAGYEQAYQRWMAGPRVEMDKEQAFFTILER